MWGNERTNVPTPCGYINLVYSHCSTYQNIGIYCVLSRSVVSYSVIPWTVARQAPLSMRIFQARILEWVAMSSSRGSSQPRDSAFQADSLPSEPPRKPKDTGAGSLSLLRGIFPTQVSNRGLLHCRQILYQLSYQGSPRDTLKGTKLFWYEIKEFVAQW